MTHNEVMDAVVGQVVQAGMVQGGVHFHAGVGTAAVLPRQLPADPGGFVGREIELARLDKLLGTEDERGAAHATMRILLVTGVGGLGKTWLALHWAHRVSERFPDGQLFVDLRGFSPEGAPTSPEVVLRGFLEALEVAPDRVPAEVNAQAALFRSLSAGKRMLVVLDNVANTAQVMPLLPGSASCAVLVTSRDRLPALIIGHSARPVALEAFGFEQARALLSARLSPRRLEDEALAVDELVHLCKGFPLALAIIAGRADNHPHIPLASFAAELRTTGLAAMDDADPAASLPDVFSWSYQALDDRQARAFSLLGISPGPDIAPDAAAALIGVPLPEAAAILRDLCKASLVDRDAHGRYVMHDLVRRFAADLGHRLPAGERITAVRRVLDFYVHTALTADRILEPYRDRAIPGTWAGPNVGWLSDPASCLRWFDLEHRCLSAARRTAVELGLHRLVWDLAWATDTFHYRRGHRHEQVRAWQDALHAAECLDSPVALVYAHRGVGIAHARLGHHMQGIRHLQQAVAIAEDTSDHYGQADAHYVLAWIREQQHDTACALGHAVRALNLYRNSNDPIAQADTINAIGSYLARHGNLDLARRYCQVALALHRHHNHRAGQAHVLDGLGYIAHHAADHATAVHHYGRAALLYEELGDDYFLADTLEVLGDVYTVLQRHDRARATWRRAIKLYNAQRRGSNVSRLRSKRAARPAAAPS